MLAAMISVANAQATESSSKQRPAEQAVQFEETRKAQGLEELRQAIRKQKKIDKLASHVTKTYDVRPAKARLVVTEATRYAKQHELEPELVLAVIATESTFRADAVSRAGAKGLMQIIPRWHREKISAIGGSDALFEPDKNILVGTQILREYLNRSRGNVRTALLRYNGSLGKRSGYASKVLRHYHRFKRIA
jgi:soluble lytic murein transglycosylase-like protein